MGVVYFIRFGKAGPIKVGTTRNLELRLQALDCGPEPLSVIGTISGGRVLEKSIHRALRPYRTRLEWFRPDQEVLAFVEKALANPRAIPAMVADYAAMQEAHRSDVARDARSAAAAVNWAIDRICRREGTAKVVDISGVTDDQILKYRRGKSQIGCIALSRLKAEWPDDFAYFDLIVGAPSISAEEIRSNRATLEAARDAIDSLLGQLKVAA